MIMAHNKHFKLKLFLLCILISSCGEVKTDIDAERLLDAAQPQEVDPEQPQDAESNNAEQAALEEKDNDVAADAIDPLETEGANHSSSTLPSKTLLDIPYGDHESQKLDIYLPNRNKNAVLPVAVMVHGGGWFTGDKAAKKVIGFKKDYFHARGYAFVSVNYRLAPENMYPDAPNDVASALSALENSPLKIDTSKMILIGHSAGAHLVNLIATNGRFLRDVNFSRDNIKAFISLDTYFYDIEQSSAIGDSRAQMIDQFFGTSTLKMKDGSPLLHVDVKTPPMLNFNRPASKDEMNTRSDYISKIEGFGKLVSGKILVNYDHTQFNELFGKPDDIMTKMSDEFLDKLGL